MIIGVGLDLIEVARIEKAIKTDRFLQRIYSETERQAISDKGAQTAAGYFAAKEAVAKALGCGFDGFGPAAIEVHYNDKGAPQAILSAGALERMHALGGTRIHLSITHIKDMAAATAILEGE